MSNVARVDSAVISEGNVPGGVVPVDCARQLARELDAAQAALENERNKVAGCSTAAHGGWKEGDSLHADFECAAIHDVAALYQRAEAAEARVRELSARADNVLIWVLWHHQGGSSLIGQKIRRHLGIGTHDYLTDQQIDRAKQYDAALKEPT